MKAPIETNKLVYAIRSAQITPEEKFLIDLPFVNLWVPLVSENTLQGILLLDFRCGDDLFSWADRLLLSDIVEQGGNAVRNVEMAEGYRAGKDELARAHQMLMVTQEQERNRIARELHDETVQQLLGITYQIANLRKTMSMDPSLFTESAAKLSASIETVRKEILMIIGNLRVVISELRPAGLDELGLAAAIQGFAEQLCKVNGKCYPQIDIEIDAATGKLTGPVSVCLFRVAQEALRNAVKHSQASSVLLDLFQTQHEIILRVYDDGKGFEVPQRLSEMTHGNHFGLIGIAERIRYLGGEVSIESRSGQGTTVSAKFPVQRDTHV